MDFPDFSDLDDFAMQRGGTKKETIDWQLALV